MKQFEFQLNKTDIDFLEKNIKNDAAILSLCSARKKGPIVIKGKYPTDKFKVIFSSDILLQILDELSDLLSLNGLAENSEPNSLGRRIETLIDSFSIIYDE
jgi:hypothetical protein